MAYSVLAVAAGAVLGALARWLLSMALNGLFPAIPPGTLLANLLGCFLIGGAMALASSWPTLSPHWQLFFVTGFLGSLTTFSTFSAEVVTLLRQGRNVMAVGAIGLHAGGALLMTLLGLWAVQWLRRGH